MRMATGTVGGSTVHVEVGDISQAEVDGIVVPQFATALSTGGVGGAVLRSGAEAGMWAFRELVRERGTLPFGTAVATDSGGAHARTLVHAVSVGSGQAKEFGTVALAFRAALKAAVDAGLHTLAAPALGTGIIGMLTARQSAEAMLAALEAHGRDGGAPMEVSLVMYDAPEMAKAFADVMVRRSYLGVDMGQAGLRGFGIERLVLAKIAIEQDEHLNEEAFGTPTPM